MEDTVSIDDHIGINLFTIGDKTVQWDGPYRKRIYMMGTFCIWILMCNVVLHRNTMENGVVITLEMDRIRRDTLWNGIQTHKYLLESEG
jgi:hypothetical protein